VHILEVVAIVRRERHMLSVELSLVF